MHPGGRATIGAAEDSCILPTDKAAPTHQVTQKPHSRHERLFFDITESTLSGNFAAFANTNAPPEAAKTEAFSADLTPVPAAMPMAKANSSDPATSAAKRILHPTSNATASADSAIVTNQASAGIVPFRWTWC